MSGLSCKTRVRAVRTGGPLLPKHGTHAWLHKWTSSRLGFLVLRVLTSIGGQVEALAKPPAVVPRPGLCHLQQAAQSCSQVPAEDRLGAGQAIVYVIAASMSSAKPSRISGEYWQG
jgi:hypothetical protein